jgi:hypothetical protein
MPSTHDATEIHDRLAEALADKPGRVLRDKEVRATYAEQWHGDEDVQWVVASDHRPDATNEGRCAICLNVKPLLVCYRNRPDQSRYVVVPRRSSRRLSGASASVHGPGR